MVFLALDFREIAGRSLMSRSGPPNDIHLLYGRRVVGSGRDATANCLAYASCHPLLSSLTKYPPRASRNTSTSSTPGGGTLLSHSARAAISRRRRVRVII